MVTYYQLANIDVNTELSLFHLRRYNCLDYKVVLDNQYVTYAIAHHNSLLVFGYNLAFMLKGECPTKMTMSQF